MQAQLDITRLITLYAHLLDDQLYDDLSELLASDATLSVPGRTITGKEAVMQRIVSVQPEQPGKHFTGTPVIEVIDEQTAHAWTDMVGFVYRDGVPHVQSLHRYHDVVTRENGRWVFQHRFMQAPGQVAHADAPPLPKPTADRAP